MGNSNPKVTSETSPKHDHGNIYRLGLPYLSQVNLSQFVNNLSGRSFASGTSHQSTYSVSRPWSRVSRRRWHESTLNDPFEASKTAWPVPFVEALFLPEFKINGNVTESDFEVIGPISKGAFGKVYKVVKKDSNEVYALKVLSKSQIISDNAINQVKEEVKIQSMCGHNPFIVNCPFYWQNRKRLFIVSEFVSGGELFQLCADYGALPLELAQIYVAQLAFAIDFLHNAGIIYRDLKLENVLLDSFGNAQLIDFGLAKWLKYGSRTSTLCGTLLYMAPEVLGMTPYTHAIDWWSLGVVACVMITAKFPTTIVNAASADPENAAPGSLPATSSLNPAGRTLLARLLDTNPTTRLRSILKLQEVAFFKGFNFAAARAKNIIPKDILLHYFPDGPPPKSAAVEAVEAFENFNSG